MVGMGRAEREVRVVRRVRRNAAVLKHRGGLVGGMNGRWRRGGTGLLVLGEGLALF